MRPPTARPFILPLYALASLATGLLALGIAPPVLAAGQDQDGALMVAATVGMIGDAVDEVGGECVDVTTIMGSGVDPHVYQASARDVRTFSRADVIFYSGYFLEGQLGEVLGGFARRKPAIALSEEAIPREMLIATQDDYGVDPHVWMDASLWARLLPVIAAVLSELRPACGEQFEANAQRYTGELAALHDWVGRALATIPEERRVLVTAHDAFAYYGRAYGLEVAGIQGISTESEAGVADIRKMARVVAERQVPAVFVESTINPRTIRAVVEAAQRLGQPVEIGEELYSDAMGEKGTPAGTYIGMIYENTANIVGNLGGDVPPLPEELSGWSRQWDLEAGEQ